MKYFFFWALLSLLSTCAKHFYHGASRMKELLLKAVRFGFFLMTSVKSPFESQRGPHVNAHEEKLGQRSAESSIDGMQLRATFACVGSKEHDQRLSWLRFLGICLRCIVMLFR